MSRVVISATLNTTNLKTTTAVDSVSSNTANIVFDVDAGVITSWAQVEAALPTIKAKLHEQGLK